MGILSKPKKNDSLPQENVHYRFTGVDIGGESLNAITIIDGPYKDVVYYYGKVKVVQPEIPGSSAVLSFHYHIHSTPSNITSYMLASSEPFKYLCGDILMSIILHNEQGEYATIREHDSKESDL